MSTEHRSGTAALVITMWEQYGAGMVEVAELVARALSLPVTGQAFSSEEIEAQEAATERNGGLLDRLARVVHLRGIGEAQARRRQEREDRVRAEMAERFNRWDPRGTDYWDLVVNTSTFGLDGAAALVTQAVRRISG